MSVTYWVCVAGWLAGWWALGRPRPLTGSTDAALADAAPSDAGTTVIIPARNEAASLGGVLGDLTRSARRPRVIVVDDDSEDDTAAIARRVPEVELVESGQLPTGWAGKCWACDRGVAASAVSPSAGERDDLLIFLDADVRLEPDALGRLVDVHARTGGLVSVQPWHDTERPYEQLSALFNVIALMGTGAGSGEPSGAFGPVLVTTRDDYRSIGGHAAVRDQVVEDLALAGRYRERSLPVTVFTGGDLIRFRMYPTGVGDLVEGWTKNFALGAGATSLPRLLAIVLWITAMGSAAVAVVDAARGRTSVALALIAYAAVVAQLTVMFRRVGRFGPLTALAYPVLLVVFVGVFVRSLWRTHVRRSVAWRGRSIATTSRRP